jgi:hypothetical protein
VVPCSAFVKRLTAVGEVPLKYQGVLFNYEKLRVIPTVPECDYYPYLEKTHSPQVWDRIRLTLLRLFEYTYFRQDSWAVVLKNEKESTVWLFTDGEWVEESLESVCLDFLETLAESATSLPTWLRRLEVVQEKPASFQAGVLARLKKYQRRAKHLYRSR